jgi:hypothetical protein
MVNAWETRATVTPPGEAQSQLEKRIETLSNYAVLLKKLPEMKEQRSTVNVLLRSLETYKKALDAGFSPVTVPGGNPWQWGVLSKPFLHFPHQLSEARLFLWPLPHHAVESYQKAKRLKVFDCFTVHSTVGEAFSGVRPVSKPSDPLLIGWINARIQAEGWNPGIIKRNSRSDGPISLLIAQWDLEKDLERLPER